MFLEIVSLLTRPATQVTGGIGSLDAFVLGEPNEAWENINTSGFNT